MNRPRRWSPRCAASPSTRRLPAASSAASATYDDIAGGHRRLRAHAVAGSARSTASSPATRTRSTPRRSAAGRSSTARAAATIATRATPSSPLFADQKFHNIGVAAHKQDFVAARPRGACSVVRTGDQKQIDQLALETKFSELGRFLVTKQQNDIGAFKTPTLRNIAVTGPYMHDGSLATLWDVMDHYNKGGIPNPYLDGGMQRLGLTEPEIDDLVAFLFALTG